MGPYKALGLNSFQSIFYLTFWSTVSHDVWELVANSITTGHIHEGLARTLIVLILKNDNPTSLKEFRPISLCNVVLKVVSKVIVNRVRPHSDNIIGSLQSSFIPGMGSKDNVIIA